MTPTRWVGSTAVRAATVGLAAATAGVAAADPIPEPYGFYVVVACGLLTFMAFVHCFAAVFRAWMRFAEALHTVVITTLFGAVYLLIVPLFGAFVWVRDPLRLRRARSAQSSWVPRNPEIDPVSMERMG